MRNLRKTISLIFFVLILMSCENRLDPFHTHNEMPQLKIVENIDDEGTFSLTAEMKFKETKTFYLQCIDDYIDNVDFSYQLICNDEYPDTNADSISIEIDKENLKVKITSLHKNYSRTNSSETESYSIKIISTDAYDYINAAFININFKQNSPAEVRMEAERIRELEYTINAMESADADGDDIIAYEYLIGGTPMFNNEGYEGLSSAEFNVNPGRAGKGGTYIISTPYSKVNHAFTQAGNYNIFIRAKDELGLWSRWHQFNLQAN